MPYASRVGAVVLLVLGVLAASGCGSRPEVVDLLALFPFTERGLEAGVIDVGAPDAEPHLARGWSRAETLPTGETVAWGMARRSTVRFAIAEPADARLVLRCGVPGDGGRGPVPVIVSLNRRRIGSMRLGRDLGEHVVRVPARVQRFGVNELALSNPFVSTVALRTRRRARPLACDAIRLEGLDGDAASRPAVVRDGPTPALAVPAAARVDFHLRVPPRAALAFAVEAARPQARLRLTVATDGSERVVFEGGPSSRAARVDLSALAGRLARLSLEAVGDRVLVRAPRVLGAPPPPAAAPPPRPAGGRPNVLLYVVDTLRADHLGCYGYDRPTSPRIDALAAESLLFLNAVAQASWTTPATASILTGRYPLGHGALTLGEGLRPDVPLLAEILRAEGYRTGAFVTNGNVTGSLGFRRGFEQYEYLPEDRDRPTLHVPVDELHASVLAWLRRGDRRPFFLYVHATDPHAPYLAPERFRARFTGGADPPPLAAVAEPVRAIMADASLRTPENVAHLRALYDAEIAFTDAGIGELLDALRAEGLYDRTLIVLVGDHGEELYDHGRFGHGHGLYGEQTRIPLIVRPPGGVPGGRTIAALARQIDVLPTVLQRLGLAPPAGVDGRVLVGAVAGDEPAEAFTGTSLGDPEQAAVVTAGWKVIQSQAREPRFEVYDLRGDPAERRDVAAAAPLVLGYGRQLLARWAADVPRHRYEPGIVPAAPSMDARTRRRLEALGYVDRQRRDIP